MGSAAGLFFFLLLVLIGAFRAVTVRWWLGLQWLRWLPHTAGSWFGLLAGMGEPLSSSQWLGFSAQGSWVPKRSIPAEQTSHQCAGHLSDPSCITHGNASLFKASHVTKLGVSARGHSTRAGIPPGVVIGDHQSNSLQLGCPLVAVWLWESYFSSPCLNFLINKIGEIALLPSEYSCISKSAMS